VAEYVIDAEARTVVGKKVRQVRNQGYVPITVYGPKIKPVSLQVQYRPLELALMHAGGTNLIDLKVGKESHTVLAREVQRDVLRGSILHVDFFAVDLKSTIRADIPIHLIGESPAVTAREGILITGPSALTVETLPDHLISQIVVDLSKLTEVGVSILVKDLEIGEDIVIINDPEEMIARISATSAARAELLGQMEAEDSAEGEAMGSEPEVIAKRRGEEDKE
jgi:large subunit ribosomal protein L25